MWRTLLGIGVKQHAPSKKPTNNNNSLDETATAHTCTVNLGKYKCRAKLNSRKKWWQNTKGNN